MTMSGHRYRLTAGILGMGLVVLICVASRPAPNLVLDSQAIVALPVITSGCSVDSRCLSMEEHKMVSGSSFIYDAHTCAGPISHSGPVCPNGGGGGGRGDGDPEIPIGLDDVLKADPIHLAQMTEMPYTNVRWNSERQAIQMVDCFGQIVLHLPLSPTEAAVFSD